MSAFATTVTVSSTDYPNRLNPTVTIPFEPNSILISQLGGDEVRVSFSDGIKDDGYLVPSSELRTQTWAVRSQAIWLRLAASGTATVRVEASEGPL